MTTPRLLAAAGAATAVVIAVTVVRHDDAGRATPAVPVQQARTQSGPSAVSTPSPASPTALAATPTFGHDADGARAAALAYLAAGPSLATMDEDDAVAAQRAMASANTADELATNLRDERAALVEGFGPGRLRWWVAPLATSVAAQSPDAAEVSIWYVSVVAPAGRPPYEDWRLARTGLVWEASTWKVAAEHDGPGPRPGVMARPEPSSPAELTGALAGFVAIGATS